MSKPQCFSTQDTNGENSVALRQGRLKQFNVSVLRILMEIFCFIKTRKPEAIQRFSAQDTNGNTVFQKGNLKQFNVSVLRILMETLCFIKTRKPEAIQCFCA